MAAKRKAMLRRWWLVMWGGKPIKTYETIQDATRYVRKFLWSFPDHDIVEVVEVVKRKAKDAKA